MANMYLIIKPKSLRMALLIKMKQEPIKSYRDDLIGTEVAFSPVVYTYTQIELNDIVKRHKKVLPSHIAHIEIPFMLYSPKAIKEVKKHAEKMLESVGLNPKGFSFYVEKL